MKMTHGSLFSGGGGFDLAAQWMGWKNVFHCEWDSFCKINLKYYWPNAISYDDITKTDFTIHRGTIDILTGGFPCQPYSVAGNQLGTEDDRHLWPEMLRAIREIQPGYVVGENVRGLVNWNRGMVFEQVQADLENEGYEVLPCLLPIAGIGAPHERYRIFFIAHRYEWTGPKHELCSGWDMSEKRINQSGINSDSANTGIESVQERENKIHESEIVTDTGLLGSEISKQQTAGIEQCGKGNASHTISQRGCSGNNQREHAIYVDPRSEALRSRVDFSRWPTQSPLCFGNDEFSMRLDGTTFSKWRNESNKIFGNAVAPELVYKIFKAIESITLPSQRNTALRCGGNE